MDTTELTELPEQESMELGNPDEEEKAIPHTSLAGHDGEPGSHEPGDPEGAAPKEPECTVGSVSSLPRNKEELERTIQNIQTAITGDILPRLHKCLASTVILLLGPVRPGLLLVPNGLQPLGVTLPQPFMGHLLSQQLLARCLLWLGRTTPWLWFPCD